MVKNKESMFSYLGVLYNSKVFSKNIEKKKSIYYFIIYLILISIFAYLKNKIVPVSSFSGFWAFVVAIIGVLLTLLIFHSLIFIVINSYSDTKKKFLNSFLGFGLIVLPFFVIGHLLTVFMVYTYSSTLVSVLILLLIVLLIYLIVVLVRNLKVYYKVSTSRVLTSLLVTILTLGFFTVILNLLYLFSLLK